MGLRAALACLASSLVLIGGGCGEAADSGPERGAGDGSFPVKIEDATTTVTIGARPERIVSLSPSATETLFALGAGDQVIAVDAQSDFPDGAPRTSLSSFEPNIESIVSYDPDLVVVPASVPRDVIAGLRKVGATVLAEPAPERLDEAYEQMAELGLATGRADAGTRLAQQVRGRVERAIARAPQGGSLRVFHELDPKLFSASSESFIGRIYARLGLHNIADAAAQRAGTPYPQLSTEAVVAADPDLIVLADGECCDQTPAKVAERPGWGAVAAVRNDAVVAIDDDIASRWGPRIPIFVERVVAAMQNAR